MRKLQSYQNVEKGDTRKRSGFLFVPKTLARYDENMKYLGKETRWLEYAEWQEQYVSQMSVSGWFANRWL
jgi:hypothetical protein